MSRHGREDTFITHPLKTPPLKRPVGRRGIYYSNSVYQSNTLINGENETPIGVAVVKAPIAPLEEAFVKAYDGIVMLTDPNGIVFISNRDEWVMKTLSALSDDQVGRIRKNRQFGQGPWDWTGITIIDGKHAKDNNGNEYLFHKLAIEHYPGWNLIFLSDIDSILNRVYQPLLTISGFLIATLCSLIGVTIFTLYRKANNEIIQRKKAETQLIKTYNDLEIRVSERTLDLTNSINELQKEIVERKRVEVALRASEEKYRTLTDNLSVGVFRTSPGPNGSKQEKAGQRKSATRLNLHLSMHCQ